MLQEKLNNLGLDIKRKESILTVIDNIKNIHLIKEVILFGSCAKGNANKYSDIDICVLTKGNDLEDKDEDIIITKAYNLDNQGKDIYSALDLIIMSERMYEDTKNEFGLVTKQISKYGISLWKDKFEYV